jgi:hypothetical protein
VPWEETDQYIRSGHRNPDDFESDSLRTITISEEEGIKAVVGKLKGEDKTTVQSYLFAKDKGWDLEKAKAWFEEHKPVKEHVQAILPFSVVEKIVDKPLRIRGVAMTAGMSRNFNIYTPEELQAFASKLVSAPVYVEHVSVDNAVGKVTKTEWDGQTLWYEAEIFESDVADKIRKGLVQHVSVGADYETLDVVDGKIPHGLHNAELSLVAVPGIPETNIQILERLLESFKGPVKEYLKEQGDVSCVFCGNPADYLVSICQSCFDKISPAGASAGQGTPTGIENMKEEDLKKLVDERVKAALKKAGISEQGARTDAERAKAHFNISDEDWDKLSEEQKQEYIDKLPDRGSAGQTLTVDQIKAKIADLAKRREEIMAQLYPEAELTDEQRTALNAEAETIWAEIEALEKALAELIVGQMGETLGEGYRVVLEVKLKEAEWDTEYVNDLPNSSFAYIESGGEKDEQGKTTPRSLRHLPFKDKEGNIDQEHLAAALQALGGARTGEPLPYAEEAKPKLCAAAKEIGMASEVCGLTDQSEALREKLTETEGKLSEAESKLAEANKTIEELRKQVPGGGLLTNPPKMIPISEAVAVLEGLLPSPAVERSTLGMQRECQEIRNAIFKLKEQLKSG